MSNPNKQMPIGIDLGTTESVLAYVDETGKAVTWKPRGGSALHASAVLVKNEKLYIGDDAILEADDESTLIDYFKRDMGKGHTSVIVNEVKVPPEVLSGYVLKHMRERAEKLLGQINDVVVTVPAYFDSKRRQATHEAGRLAGLNVVSIINEPSAAAIGYCDMKGYVRGGTDTRTENLLIYDFGGGTFDTTVITCGNGKFTTLATDGDVYLGGFDIDEELADWLGQQFLHREWYDPREAAGGWKSLMLLANGIKHDLSESDTSVVNMFYDNRSLDLEITREFFNSLIAPFVDRTIAACEDVLFSARKSWDEIDTILLCGGTSQIPYISERLREASKIDPIQIDNPQELVAKGCALYAATLSENAQLNFEVANVNSHSLGIRGRDVETGRPTNRILIPRNSTLPSTVIKKFVTSKDDQEHVFLVLLEGESENPSLCFEVGKFKVALGEGVRKGDVIEVYCRYNEDGRIDVYAKSPENPSLGRLAIKRSHTRLESLEVWRNKILYGVNFEVDDEEDSFEGMDVFADDVPFGYREIAELDGLLVSVGAEAKRKPLPKELHAQQRFTLKLAREIEILDHLIEVGEDKVENQMDVRRQRKLRRHVYELKALRIQRRKAHDHAVMALGRQCFQQMVPDNVVSMPYEEVNRRVTELKQVWY
jgi:molecular chaperone DnaK